MIQILDSILPLLGRPGLESLICSNMPISKSGVHKSRVRLCFCHTNEPKRHTRKKEILRDYPNSEDKTSPKLDLYTVICQEETL